MALSQGVCSKQAIWGLDRRSIRRPRGICMYHAPGLPFRVACPGCRVQPCSASRDLRRRVRRRGRRRGRRVGWASGDCIGVCSPSRHLMVQYNFAAVQYPADMTTQGVAILVWTAAFGQDCTARHKIRRLSTAGDSARQAGHCRYRHDLSIVPYNTRRAYEYCTEIRVDLWILCRQAVAQKSRKVLPATGRTNQGTIALSST